MATVSIGGSGFPSSAGQPVWGIFSPDNQLIYTPTEGGTLSFVSLGFTQSVNVSDFPLEAPGGTDLGASFASYNKVYQPYNPIVTLALSGTETEKIQFLGAIQKACQNTSLWNIKTPDVYYTGIGGAGACTVERYSYQRSATRGASLLIVEISLKQVNQITSQLSNTTINNPQSPSSQDSVSSGNVQSSSPNVPTSTLYDAAHALGVN